MNIEALAHACAESLREQIKSQAADIESLVVSCARESEKQGRKVLPRLSFAITLDGDAGTHALSYGVRTRREGAFDLQQVEMELGTKE